MSLNSMFLWIAAAVLTGALCAFTAVADVARPEAYERLSAVELRPGHAPKTINGLGELSGSESHFRERLPLQLDGPLKKIKKAKYSPSIKRHHKKQRSIQRPSKSPRNKA